MTILQTTQLQNWEAGKQRGKKVDTIKNIRLNIRKGRITVLN
jgi:sporulation protein YlmC with PRC-barrel domain